MQRQRRHRAGSVDDRRGQTLVESPRRGFESGLVGGSHRDEEVVHVGVAQRVQIETEVLQEPEVEIRRHGHECVLDTGHVEERPAHLHEADRVVVLPATDPHLGDHRRPLHAAAAPVRTPAA